MRLLLFLFVINSVLSQEPPLLHSFFENITIKVNRNGSWFTEVDAVDVSQEQWAMDIVIESQSATKPIRELQTGTFSNLTHLRYLKLIDNGIKVVRPRAFINLPALRTLLLHRNEIENIPTGVFEHLNIVRLSFYGNSIKTIADEAFNDLPELEVLDLSNNHLEVFTRHMFNNVPNIRELYLSFNKLKSISDRAFEHIFSNNVFHDRNIIDFSSNSIDRVHPNAFQGLRDVYELRLNDNRLAELKFVHLKHVRVANVFNLKSNCFNELHSTFFSTVLNNTKEIVLDNNPWTCTFVKQVLKWEKMRENSVSINSRHCNIY